MGKDVGKLELWCFAGGNVTPVENSATGPNDIQHIITTPSSNFTSGLYSKELKRGTQKDICTPTFIAALFTIAKSWKQPECPSRDEWIKKLWCKHLME